MTRIACLMMQRGENLLLRPWLLYHGHLFGFENLFVFDDGSGSEGQSTTLQELAARGVHVDVAPVGPSDTEDVDALFSRRIAEFRAAGSYDIAVPLDCDEFVAINGSNGIECERAQILNEMDRMVEGGVDCRTEYCLENLPGHLDLYRYTDHQKCILLVEQFPDIQRGFRETTLPLTGEYGPTEIIYIRLPFGPFRIFVEKVSETLEPLVDITDPAALENYEGPHAHLKGYLFMSSDEYYAYDFEYPHPVVRFRGLTRFFEALLDLPAIRAVWEEGRPEELPDDVIEFDLDATPFRPSDYLAANETLPASGMDLFTHFLQGGFESGFPLNSSDEGLEEMVQRLAELRAKKRDGVSGYDGLFEAMSRVARERDVDEILREAIDEFGETEFLLREYASTALYLDATEEAIRRWQRYREAFPNDPRGYAIGSLAILKSGDLEQAERLAAHGLEKFPQDVGLRLRLMDIARDRGDWPRVKTLWDELARAAPDDPEVKETAGAVTFEIRSWQDEQLAATPVGAIDGPVLLNMSEEQTRESLAILGCKDTRDMRQLFMGFESLGHTCEFGLVQRRHGAEPISLLRWNGISSSMLIAALESRFAGIDHPDNLMVQKVEHEYVLRDRNFFTYMHTFITDDVVDAELLVAKQVKRMGFLKNKLLGDLAAGEKIFVHLADGTLSSEEVQRLQRAVRSYGDARLFYVDVAQTPAQAGTVEVADDGLLCGYIRRLGDRSHQWDIDFDSWLRLCRAAAAHPATTKNS
jgi:tetratricopeptide (TPR) repeat protein